MPLLCHYEDRMSMAMSREIRLLLLDSRLMDFVLRAPDDYKLRHGWTKYVFRKAMEPLLPAPIAWRRDKQGFANPEGEWLEAGAAEVGGGGVRGRQPHRAQWPRERPGAAPALWSNIGGNRWMAARSGIREIFAPLSLESWMRRYAQSDRVSASRVCSILRGSSRRTKWKSDTWVLTVEQLGVHLDAMSRVPSEKWLSGLEDRKRKELEFHDPVPRTGTLKKQVDQDTYEKLYGNEKYYNTDAPL